MVGIRHPVASVLSIVVLACLLRTSSAAAEWPIARTSDVRPAGGSLHGDFGYWFDTLPALGFGVGVAPGRAGGTPRPNAALEPSAGFLAAPALGVPLYRLVDTELLPGALSLDLRLRGPSWTTNAASEGQLQPYLAVGPALFLGDAPEGHTLGTSSDVSMSMGMKAGAGINWQLRKNASLFGEFRFMRSAADKLLSAGGHTLTDKDLNARDFLYGFSLRF